MPIKVQLVLESDAGNSETVEIAQIQRNALSPVNVGLTLAESKVILHHLQVQLVSKQVADYQQQQRVCPHCQQPRRLKEHRSIVYKTLFANLSFPAIASFTVRVNPIRLKVSVPCLTSCQSEPLQNCCT